MNRGSANRATVTWLLLCLLASACAGGSDDPTEPGGAPPEPSARPSKMGMLPRLVRLERDGTYSRAACDSVTAPGNVRCLARLQSDATGAVNALATPSTKWYGPADLRNAYSIPVPDDAGTTIAIVDAYDAPNAESDLATYRSYFNLPPCTTNNGCFRKVNQNGTASPLPAASTNWSKEIALDLDVVSAACPRCKILLVEANSAANSNLFAAVRTAANLGAPFISNSWGGDEQANDAANFNIPGVSIFASSGDDDYGIHYPASSAYVTAVGGTHLTRTTSSRGWDETVWGDPDGVGNGAGSGCSQIIGKPSWQPPIAGCSRRAEADVSAVADPATGVAVYDSYGIGGWARAGGTSAASPLVAAIYAATGKRGATPALSYMNLASFNDVVTGQNGTCGNALCTAGPGWDGPTGNGTPNGALLCPAHIDSIYPPSGRVGDATTVTITGTCLGGVDRVSLTKGNATVSPVSFNIVSGRKLTIALPASPDGQDGVADLELDSGGATFRHARFSYISSSLTLGPANGPTAGGTDVTIQGDGLGVWPTRVTATFGGVPAPYDAYCASPTSCTVVTPPHAVGPVEVIVTIDGAGQIVAAPFVYQGPGITSVSPAAGPISGGTLVDIHGSDFDPNMSVWFGWFASPYVVCDGTTWCTVLSPAVSGPGVVDIWIMLPDGTTGVIGPSDRFTYNQLPRLTNVDSQTGVDTFVGGATAGLFVGLDGYAPAGGTVVSLSSSQPSVVSVPASVTVPAGSRTGSFNATVVGMNVTTNVVVTASYGGISATKLIHIVPTPAPRLALSAPSVLSTQTVDGMVVLAEPALANAVVNLSSSDPRLTVPASVPVAKGATKGTFVATAGSVSAPTAVTVTASYFGVTTSIPLQVLPWAPVALRLSPSSIRSNETLTGYVTLGAAAPTGGATVTLSSSNHSASIPASVPIAAGSAAGTFTVRGLTVTSPQSATITATYQGATASASMMIYPPDPPPDECCFGGCPSGRICSAACTCVLPTVP